MYVPIMIESEKKKFRRRRCWRRAFQSFPKLAYFFSRGGGGYFFFVEASSLLNSELISPAFNSLGKVPFDKPELTKFCMTTENVSEFSIRTFAGMQSAGEAFLGFNCLIFMATSSVVTFLNSNLSENFTVFLILQILG